MTSDSTDPDPRLREALSEVVSSAGERVDWAALHHRVVVSAEVELARRRHAARRRLVGVALGAVAAVLAVMLLGPSRWMSGEQESVPDGGLLVSVDELLNDRRSDDELRAVLDGADEADALLLIAADEARATEEAP